MYTSEIVVVSCEIGSLIPARLQPCHVLLVGLVCLGIALLTLQQSTFSLFFALFDELLIKGNVNGSLFTVGQAFYYLLTKTSVLCTAASHYYHYKIT